MLPAAYMNKAQVAKHLGLSVRTVHQLSHRSLDPIPFFRFGRAVRYRPSDLEVWADRQKAALAQDLADAIIQELVES